MVPLQASSQLAHARAFREHLPPTELLLDDLEDLLLIEFFGETLDSRQSLSTISLYRMFSVSNLIA